MRKDMARVIVERPRFLEGVGRKGWDHPFEELPKQIGMRRSERERRIEAEVADLDAAKSKLPPLAPEVEWEVNRAIERMNGGQNASSGGTVTG